MILTTLVPTAIHLFLASVAALSAAGLWLSRGASKARDRMLRDREAGHKEVLLTFVLPCGVAMAAAALVVSAGALSVYWDAPLHFIAWLGDHLLDTAEFAVRLLN